MARFSTANDIINRAAVESGLLKDPSPVESSDESFVQLAELLNACGQELVELHAWQLLVGKHQILTAEGQTGSYDLPDDFSYMIDQTGWEHSNTAPLGGPLSAQDWTYLEGRNLVSDTIYASFRLVDNKFDIFPQDPVPAGLDINFEYISRNWAEDPGSGLRKDSVTVGSDIVLYEPIMMVKFLRLKFLSARGFDTAAAAIEFQTIFDSRTGKDAGAQILNASNNARGFPYLSPYRNTGDSGMGFS
jgi:hypothetical protein